ncbi:undecaprenyl-phosphate galactose phosphotransferase WbaP [Klebsiella aerogenes]|nr:undecaprenyl-phosphate galactose phosphotransferase WbaP [Klebsiella aerogenes]
MAHLNKNLCVSAALALSDFLSFTIPIYLGILIVSLTFTNGPQLVQEHSIHDWTVFHFFLGFVCVGWFAIRLRHYFYRKTFWFELKEILRTLIIFAVIETAVMAFSKWYISWYVWSLSWLCVLFFVPVCRMLTKYFLNLFGLWKREAIIVGNGKNAIEAWKAIDGEKNLGFKVKQFIAAEKNGSNSLIDQVSVKYYHPNELCANFDKQTQFIIALEADQGSLRNDWLRLFMINGYRYVSVIPTLRGIPLDNTDMSFIFSHEVMIFRVHQNLAKVSSRILKRAFDIVGSLGIILLSSPLLIYICYKVKKDHGPAIYGHERIGKGGKPFKCLKFRSMVTNSKEVLDDLLSSDAEAKKEWDATFKLKDDPRITPIGHFLRKTSLDELPQLFNVLKGEMSLVGPRPIITAELERYSDEVDYYLLSKPGMTGLWQVSGRSDVDYETRVYLDAWYVKNWSMWNDIAILFKTISVVLRKDGAY